MLTRRSLLSGWGVLLTADRSASAKPAVPKKFERWLGRRTLTILLAAKRVEPFAVRPRRAGDPTFGKNLPTPVLPQGTPTTIRGFPVHAVGPVQSSAFAKRLVAVLLDATSYRADGPPFSNLLIKGCIPMPGVAFRVWDSRRSVDLLICFTCDQLMVGRTSDRYSTMDMADADFDPSRAKLVALAHEALPDVEKIRALTEARPKHAVPPE